MYAEWKGKPVLVTGGAGFIGSNLVEALLKQGTAVRLLDGFSTGRRENLAEAGAWAKEGGGRFEMVEGSVCDPETVSRAVGGAGAVLHQAAIASVPRSVKDPLRTNEVTVTG